VRAADWLKRNGGIAAGLIFLAIVLLALAPSPRTMSRPDTSRPGTSPSADTDPVVPEEQALVEPGRNVTPPAITQRSDLGDAPLRRVEPPAAPATAAATPSTPDAEEPARIRLLAQPVAVDAGTIAVGRGVIDLPGLTAPDLAQRCSSGSIDWPCGIRARTELRAFLRGRSIRCVVPTDFEATQETIATRCTLGGRDIGEWLVRNGWAGAETGGPYGDAEAEAKRERRGLWR
jgi:endonuclease YncB( thermonuclease family)